MARAWTGLATSFTRFFDAWTPTSASLARGVGHPSAGVVSDPRAPCRVFSLFQFRPQLPEELPGLRRELLADLRRLGVTGRIYLSVSGINAQVSVPSDHTPAFAAWVSAHPLTRGALLNGSGTPVLSDAHWSTVRSPLPVGPGSPGREVVGPPGPPGPAPFPSLSVCLRPQLVADGMSPWDTPCIPCRGARGEPATGAVALGAAEWNALLLTGGVTVLDTRNDYEYEVGRFPRARVAPVSRFSDAFEALHMAVRGLEDEPILTYCTGGIRCVPFAQHLRDHGYTHVYELAGGVTQYVRETRHLGLPNYFQGSLYVFDARGQEPVTISSSDMIQERRDHGDIHTRDLSSGHPAGVGASSPTAVSATTATASPGHTAALGQCHACGRASTRAEPTQQLTCSQKHCDSRLILCPTCQAHTRGSCGSTLCRNRVADSGHLAAVPSWVLPYYTRADYCGTEPSHPSTRP